MQLVRTNLHHLDSRLYRSFLRANLRFFALTTQRVISYWDRYHGHQRREDYAGFQVVEFLDELVAASD